MSDTLDSRVAEIGLTEVVAAAIRVLEPQCETVNVLEKAFLPTGRLRKEEMAVWSKPYLAWMPYLY